MQVLTCYSSEQVMLVVDAIDWLAGQVNFRVLRVLHTTQATESHSNVQQPNLPMAVIDHCIPGFCCYLDVQTKTFNNVSPIEQG